MVDARARPRERGTVTVVLGVPLLTDKEARARLHELLLDAERAAVKDGGAKLRKEDREAIAARFFCSDEYLGPETAESVAGWIHRNLKILPKEGGMVPFLLNEIQWRFLERIVSDKQAGELLRYIVLKARQFGISTFVQGLYWYELNRRPGTNASTIAHKDDAALNLYEMTRRFVECAPHRPKLESFTRKGLVFARPHDARLTLGTAEGKEAKRSFTIHLAHLSEVAFWPEADITDLGLMQSIPDEPNTMVVKESTANGVGGLFYQQYWAAKAGKGRFKALFYAWHEHPRYAIEVQPSEAKRIQDTLDEEEKQLVRSFKVSTAQLAWRRFTIADKCNGDVGLFHQEYPASDREAFLVSGRPVFDLQLLDARARAAQEASVVFQGMLGYDDDGQIA